MVAHIRCRRLLLLGAALIAASIVPILDVAGPHFAFAQGNGGGNGGGGDNGNGGGSGNSEGNGGGNSSAGGNGNGFPSAGGGNGSGPGQSATAPGQTKFSTNDSGTTSAKSKSSAAALQANQPAPKAVVRQYVIETGLKQGDVAKLLKSWNSLNRNMQAYIANLDNARALPGLQFAYVKANLTAQADLASFINLGGDPTNPPTAADLQVAQDALAAQQVLDAEAVLTDPTATDEAKAAAQVIVDAYAGDDPQTVVDQFAANYAFAPQTIIDQYNAWITYQAAETTAQDAFVAASVSYKATYSDATFGELRALVDAIVAKKGLDTLVTP